MGVVVVVTELHYSDVMTGCYSIVISIACA